MEYRKLPSAFFVVDETYLWPVYEIILAVYDMQVSQKEYTRKEVG